MLGGQNPITPQSYFQISNDNQRYSIISHEVSSGTSDTSDVSDTSDTIDTANSSDAFMIYAHL